MLISRCLAVLSPFRLALEVLRLQALEGLLKDRILILDTLLLLKGGICVSPESRDGTLQLLVALL